MEPRIGWYRSELLPPQATTFHLDLWARILDAQRSLAAMELHGGTRALDFLPLNNYGGIKFEGSLHNRKNRKRDISCATAPTIISGPVYRASPGNTPWMKEGKNYSCIAPVRLHTEIEDFYEYISPTEIEAAARQDVVNRIREAITKQWERAVVEVFGSFRTGLYLPTSDIDIVVFGKWEELPLYTLKKLLLQYNIAEPDSIKVLDKASVPIVKMVDQKTGIKVDISFNMLNSVRAARLVNEFCHEFPCLRKLVMVLKQFLSQRGLNEVFTGGVSSYSLILMCVVFLKTHERGNEVRRKDENLGVLLTEFFQKFGNDFNYFELALRVKDGGAIIRKADLRRCVQPITMMALCIEDPLTPGNDIARGSYAIFNVKLAFTHAFHRLHAAMTQLVAIDPRESLLSRVISVSDETIAYRKWVNDAFRGIRIVMPRSVSSQSLPAAGCGGGTMVRGSNTSSPASTNPPPPNTCSNSCRKSGERHHKCVGSTASSVGSSTSSSGCCAGRGRGGHTSPASTTSASCSDDDSYERDDEEDEDDVDEDFVVAATTGGDGDDSVSLTGIASLTTAGNPASAGESLSSSRANSDDGYEGEEDDEELQHNHFHNIHHHHHTTAHQQQQKPVGSQRQQQFQRRFNNYLPQQQQQQRLPKMESSDDSEREVQSCPVGTKQRPTTATVATSMRVRRTPNSARIHRTKPQTPRAPNKASS